MLPPRSSGSFESEKVGTVTATPEDVNTEDGGLRGWMTVAGAWLVLFSTFGYIYSFGLRADYYTRVFLTSHSPSSIAWIGSFQLMMPFAMGLISGKLFDAGYLHSTVASGSAIFTFSLFMLSVAEQDRFYQVFLSQGLGMGLGIGLAFVPTTAVTVHHFKRRRALASGIVLSGSSGGALVFPISEYFFSYLIPLRGFGEAVRATAYIVFACLFAGNCLIKMPNHKTPSSLPDVRTFFKDPAYNFTLLGALVTFFGFFFPVVYLQLYAAEHHIDDNLAFYSLSILNASSFVGRILGNFLADIYGPWNLQAPCTLLTGATIWAVLGVHNTTTLVAVSILYGIFSGAWLSLSFAGVASLASSPNEVGYAARTGLVLGLASIGSLISAPAQGALLTREFFWVRPVSCASVRLPFPLLPYPHSRLFS
ncbi:major facilitator superfamily domain-containing protein [Infundibulicybe gibba]|nr:major facilitator superfamily domain-containing protein [Infundibulicybe gibba]